MEDYTLDPKKMGLLIKLKREALGLSPYDLGRLIDISANNIYQWEKGQSMHLGQWLKVKKVLKITDDEAYNLDKSINELWQETNPLN